MNIDEQNQKFDALRGLADGQREYLIAEARVATTEVRWDLGTALSAIGADALESDFSVTPDQCLNFGGTIITRTPLFNRNGSKNDDGWAEAQRTADARGWGEAVTGGCCGIKPAHDLEGGGLSPHLN